MGTGTATVNNGATIAYEVLVNNGATLAFNDTLASTSTAIQRINNGTAGTLTVAAGGISLTGSTNSYADSQSISNLNILGPTTIAITSQGSQTTLSTGNDISLTRFRQLGALQRH